MGLVTPLRDYQQQGLQECLPRPGSLLDMRMGTGKTLLALALLDAWEAKKTLVLCPLSVCRVWPRENIERGGLSWDFVPLDTGSVSKKLERAKLALAESQARRRPLVLTINYESVWREPFATFAKTQGWDVVVADECHRLKSAGGKASRFAASLARVSRHRLGLTGTPLPHSPLDAYAQYRFLDLRIFGASANRFRRRFFRPDALIAHKYTGEFLSPERQAEFRDLFRKIAYQVHTTEMLDLPPEVDMTRRVPLEPKARKVYESLERNFWARVEDGEITAANALSKLLRLQQLTSGYLETEEGRLREVSTAKANLLADLLFDLSPPVVVFCRFRTDLDIVHAAAHARGWKSAELSGRTKDALNGEARLAEGVDVAAVQIQAGGVGIDLSRASTAIYYSLGFSLGDYLQSRARLHRPGQQGEHVLFLHLVCENTVDRAVIGALAKRQQVIEEILSKGKPKR